MTLKHTYAKERFLFIAFNSGGIGSVYLAVVTERAGKLACWHLVHIVMGLLWENVWVNNVLSTLGFQTILWGHSYVYTTDLGTGAMNIQDQFSRAYSWLSCNRS